MVKPEGVLRWVEERTPILIAATILSLVLISIIFSSFILRSGVANAGDLTWPYFSEPGLTGLYLDNIQSGIIPSQMLVYSWLFYLPVDSAIQERLLFFGTFLLMGLSCYFVTFRIIHHEGAGKQFSHLLAGAATIAYVVNPLTFYYIVDVFLLIGYALLPALIYVVLKFVWSERSGRDMLIYGGLAGLIMTASSGDPRWPVWNLFLILSLLILMIGLGRFKGAARGVGFISITVVCFAALSAFWILPTLLVPEQATLLARPNLSLSFYYVLNKYGTLSNALVFQADFWTPTRELFLVDGGWGSILFKVAQWVLPVLAFLSLLFFWRNRLVLSLAVISFVVVLLASAPLSSTFIIREGYEYFVFNLPFGIAFRTAYKWLLLLAYPLILLAMFTIFGLVRRSEAIVGRTWPHIKPRRVGQAIAVVMVTILVSSSLIAAWPMVTGDFRGVISPSDLSNDYQTTYDLIEQQVEGSYDFKILYLPSNPYTGFPAPGLADSPYLHYLMTLLDRNAVRDLGDLLAPLGVKYVVLDRTMFEDDDIETSLKNQSDLITTFDGQQLLVMENKQSGELFRFSDPAINFDGMDAGASALAWNDWVQADQSILDLEEAFASSPYVLMGPGYPYDLMVHKSITSSPFLYVPYYGDQSWKNMVAYSPSNYEWLNTLSTIGLEDWSLDYGEGLAYVDANLSIPENLPLPDSALIKAYDLSDPATIEEFVQSNYPEQFDAIQTLTPDGGSMRVQLLNATTGWKTVRTPLIPVDTDQAYSILSKVRSRSGFDIHFKVAEYDQNRSLVSVKAYYGLGSGEIDWTSVRMNYRANNSEVSYISFQIWHGSDPNTRLPNVFWVDHISFYNTTELLSAPQLDGEISVNQSGAYRLYIRALTSPLGGNLSIAIDGREVDIETLNEDTSMSWKYGGTMELASGTHQVTILNRDGLNVVNLVSLIGEQEYRSSLERYNAQLSDKALIYQMQRTVAEDEAQDVNSSQELDPLGSLVVSKPIEIYRPGDYRLYVNSENSSVLWVDNHLIGSVNGSARYLTVHLDTGHHNLTLRTPNPDYNASEIVLFSANGGVDLEELEEFGQGVGEVLEVRKKNPSTYEVTVTGGGTLLFTNAFDTGWVLTSGDPAFASSPIPINTAENGFVVPVEGNLSLVLTYSPDQPYHTGLAISIVSAVVMTALAVIYLYRRGGRWKEPTSPP